MPKLSTASQTASSPAVVGTASSTASYATVAITTTFTPAATCNPTHLTLPPQPNNFLWVAEPVPVASSTATDCYPSEWIQNYSTAGPQGASSVAPFVSALVCPSGWSSAFGAAGGYMACCPESYQLAEPATIADPNRPAYGGLCYSDVSSGSTVQVTLYNDAGATTTTEWSPSSSGVQAYAHPIDGIAYREPVAPPDTHRQSLSAGAIAGIVIGGVVGLALLSALLFFFLRRAHQLNARRSRYALEADSDHVMRWVSEMHSEKMADGSTRKLELDGSSTTISEMSSPASISGFVDRH